MACAPKKPNVDTAMAASADPAAVIGLFDLFALSSDSEQFPISVVEAMAAGRPVIKAVGGVEVDLMRPRRAVRRADRAADQAIQVPEVSIGGEGVR